MKIIQVLKKAILTKYQNSTLYTVDAIPMYLDHVPQAVNFPVICVYAVSSNQSMAMVSQSAANGYDYVDSRFRFTVYGNERQHSQLEDIADRLEDVFHRQSLTLSDATITHIATISINQNTTFYDQQNKIWSINQTFRILAGK